MNHNHPIMDAENGETWCRTRTWPPWNVLPNSWAAWEKRCKDRMKSFVDFCATYDQKILVITCDIRFLFFFFNTSDRCTFFCYQKWWTLWNTWVVDCECWVNVVKAETMERENHRIVAELLPISRSTALCKRGVQNDHLTSTLAAKNKFLEDQRLVFQEVCHHRQ